MKKVLFLVLCIFSISALANEEQNKIVEMNNFCKKINLKFEKLGWKKISCNSRRWKYDSLSVKGEPLLYQSFMNAGADKPVTLVFCSIHSDEHASPYICFRFVRDILFDNPQKYINTNIVIAPIVNPDGFLLAKSTRLNANKVDLNRNFPTQDWNKDALFSWIYKFKKDPRRFPGEKSASEPETLFQMGLIEKFRPSRILAIHAPYGFLDYDISFKGTSQKSGEVQKLARAMGKLSHNFRVTDFAVFPGSLGNYAGIERGIPTFTLELPSSEALHGEKYWERFHESVLTFVKYSFNEKDSLITSI